MTMKYFLLFLIVMMIPMSSAFADNDDCWFIFCWFDFGEKASNEQNYVKHHTKVKTAFMNQMQEEISSLKESKKIILEAEESELIPEMTTIHNGIDNRINLLQDILDTEEDVQNNPGKYLTQSTLVKRAMNYYKIQPNGTPCDDDRRWVEDTCRPMKRANKIFYSWDLEWLRDHPEFDNR